jgi:LmbE family N-acetylglucosaminyl deacetylase
MRIASFAKAALHSCDVHPRRWLTGMLSYSRYVGYIKPQLLEGMDEDYQVRRQLLARAWQPRLLTAPVGKRILAISPHSDDETIGAGGFLLSHCGFAEIHLLCLTDGAAGGAVDCDDHAPDALIKARREEFMETARALDAASVQFLDFPDGRLPVTDDAARTLRSMVDSINPDVILLPWFLDAHPDHQKANILFARACNDIKAVVLAYEIWTMLEPNAIFEITNVMESKRALIRNYRTQLRTVDYERYALGLAQVRGYQFGVGVLRSGGAEAFVALPADEYCDLVRALPGARNDAPVQIRA